MSLRRWMVKLTVIGPYHGILLSSAKESTMDTPNNLDESLGYCAECERPVPKDCTVYDSIYLTFLKGQL